MIGSFAQARLEELPPWLAGPVVKALEAALGNDENQALRELEDVLRMYSPYTVPDDGLDALGVRFALPRYPGEPNGTAPPSPGVAGSGYRGRLCDAWDAWLWAGTAKGVQDQLIAYGFGDALCLPVYQLPIPPETAATNYAEFYVVVTPQNGSTGIVATLLGSCTLGACLLGSSATAAQILAMKRIVLKWKAAIGLPIKIWIFFGTGSAPALPTYPMGRCLGDTLAPLGDAQCVLGGYQF